jgi:hypothetical protein
MSGRRLFGFCIGLLAHCNLITNTAVSSSLLLKYGCTVFRLVARGLSSQVPVLGLQLPKVESTYCCGPEKVRIFYPSLKMELFMTGPHIPQTLLFPFTDATTPTTTAEYERGGLRAGPHPEEGG